MTPNRVPEPENNFARAMLLENLCQRLELSQFENSNSNLPPGTENPYKNDLISLPTATLGAHAPGRGGPVVKGDNFPLNLLASFEECLDSEDEDRDKARLGNVVDAFELALERSTKQQADLMMLVLRYHPRGDSPPSPS